MQMPNGTETARHAYELARVHSRTLPMWDNLADDIRRALITVAVNAMATGYELGLADAAKPIN